MISTTTKSNLLRLLRAIFIGGLFAVLALLSGIAIYTEIVVSDNTNLLWLGLSIATYILSLLGTLWATGFWGNWGLLVFFGLAPVIILLDQTLNPLFPSGTLVAAFATHRLFRKKATSP